VAHGSRKHQTCEASAVEHIHLVTSLVISCFYRPSTLKSQKLEMNAQSIFSGIEDM